MLIRELPAERRRARGYEVAARAWHRRQRWCPYPHHTARRTALDPPTRLAEGKPSRKNRPPFRGRKRTTATTLPLPPPSPPPPSPSPLDSAASFERFSRHRATTTSVILSLPRHRHCTRRVSSYDTAINRHLAERGVQRQLTDREPRLFLRERGANARAESGDAIGANRRSNRPVLIAFGECETKSSPVDNCVKVNTK